MADSRAEIEIRAMEAADWREVYTIWHDPGVRRGTLQMPFQSPDAVKKRVEDPPEGMYRLVAEVEGQLVGCGGLHLRGAHRLRHVAGCGVSVRSDYWNRGVGSALMAAMLDLADNWLDLERIELEVFCDNEAAIHLYEKSGFVVEGTKRRYALREGEYVDVYVMARVRE
jgi:putative acetyltransferase